MNSRLYLELFATSDESFRTSLVNNNIVGTIPTEIGVLSNLKSLIISKYLAKLCLVKGHVFVFSDSVFSHFQTFCHVLLKAKIDSMVASQPRLD